MELTVITTSVMLSIGLGLAGAHAMLSTAMFMMARSVARFHAVPGRADTASGLRVPAGANGTQA